MDNVPIADLDDSWVVNFEMTDAEYKTFYKEDISCIIIRCIFIDRQLNIQRITKEKIVLKTPNSLSREELLHVIKKHMDNPSDAKYSLLSIAKYNIDLEPVHIQPYLRSNNNNNNNRSQFLSTVKNVDTISFSPSIYLFQDLNELCVLFYEKSSPNNVTKRVFIHSHAKNKTIRKQFK